MVPPTWQDILDRYEVESSGNLEHEFEVAMADFVRAVMTCPGHDRLIPGTSLSRLFIAGRTDGPFPDATETPGVWWTRRSGFELSPCGFKDSAVVRRRSVYKAVRVFRRMLRRVGVKLAPPRCERPPESFYRRVWLVFPGNQDD